MNVQININVTSASEAIAAYKELEAAGLANVIQAVRKPSVATREKGPNETAYLAKMIELGKDNPRLKPSREERESGLDIEAIAANRLAALENGSVGSESNTPPDLSGGEYNDPLCD